MLRTLAILPVLVLFFIIFISPTDITPTTDLKSAARDIDVRFLRLEVMLQLPEVIIYSFRIRQFQSCIGMLFKLTGLSIYINEQSLQQYHQMKENIKIKVETK